MNPHATASTIWLIPKKNPFRRQDDVLSAAERYIDENGPEAFERMIRNRKVYNIIPPFPLILHILFHVLPGLFSAPIS